MCFKSWRDGGEWLAKRDVSVGVKEGLQCGKIAEVLMSIQCRLSPSTLPDPPLIVNSLSHLVSNLSSNYLIYIP